MWPFSSAPASLLVSHPLCRALACCLAAAVLCLVPAILANQWELTSASHPYLAPLGEVYKTALAVAGGIAIGGLTGFVIAVFQSSVSLPLVARSPVANRVDCVAGLVLGLPMRLLAGVPVGAIVYFLIAAPLPSLLLGDLFAFTVVFVTAVFPIWSVVIDTAERTKESNWWRQLEHLPAKWYDCLGTVARAGVPAAVRTARDVLLMGWSLALLAETSGVGQHATGSELMFLSTSGSMRLSSLAFVGVYIALIAFSMSRAIAYASAGLARYNLE